jgi:hypothetical protein
MKNLLLIFVSLATNLTAIAAPIPQDKLDTYKESVYLALSSFNSQTQSGFASNGSIEYYQQRGFLDDCTSGDISFHGSHLVLTFTAAHPQDITENTMITVSRDMKSIITINAGRFHLS